MTERVPEPGSGYADEGVPEMGYTLVEKEITGDPQEGLAPPADDPVAVHDYGTTAREQQEGESLDLRVTREEPDVLAAADLPADEAADTAQPFTGGEDRVGRLVEPDEGASEDAETDAVARDAGADTGGFTAEETAMHAEPEA